MNKSFKRYSRQFLCCLYIAIALLFTACATKFLPVQAPGLIVSDDIAIYKENDIVLTVAEQMWVKEPQYLSDHYSTFWVKVQNNTDTAYKISPSSFALLDEDRNQVDVQDYEYVLDIMMQNDELYIDRFLMSAQTQQQILQKRALVQRNIMLDSFAFGEILPRASKQGVIYFPKVKGSVKQLIFVFNNKEITFQRIK